ncbi:MULTISPECIES: flagellar filament capping protein FliD [Delftia]|uniref:Flagellar hook-associated protein 2 n=2 Tax=Delftia TaxID=80865 RepID=A0A7T2S1K5_DELAC|nr:MULTISPECIES: flagellar filament capping protein FliD [Delftia]MBB1652025.1 flagellar hook protein [Delftia sp. UME58]QPS07178.1 flagellar filament capping protein FliD [Delftia acidovorans]
MALTAAGIGSGLNVESMISQLVTLQKQPLVQLQTAASSLDTKISTVGSIKSLMSTLSDSARKLADKDAWALTTATASNTSVSVSVTGSAMPGSTQIDVDQVARNQSLASKSFAAASNFGPGTLKFTMGGKTTEVQISESMTMDKVVAAINAKQGDSGVVASVIKDANGERLLMRSKNSGADAQFTVEVTGADANLSSLAYAGQAANGDTSNGGVVQLAQNAKATVNGIKVESATNEFKDTIPGLSFTVNQATKTGEPTLLTVVSDTEGMKKNIQAFMDAYNAISDKLVASTKYDAESKTAGVMQGDSTMVGMTNGLREVLASQIGGINLSDLGIQLGKGGKLAFGTLAKDKSNLEAVLKDPSKLAQVFAAEGEPDKPETKGLALRMKEYADKVLEFDTGVFDAKTKGLQQLKKDNTKAQDRVNERAEAFEQRMRAQYAALDKKMGSSSVLSSYLSQQVSQWNR